MILIEHMWLVADWESKQYKIDLALLELLMFESILGWKR